MTYIACKTLIERKSYASIDDMQTKLDIFLLNDRLSQNQYNELTSQLNAA
ncbi:hypothetical protein ACQKCU_24825 [Heyndrickxia sporothermodurans]